MGSEGSLYPVWLLLMLICQVTCAQAHWSDWTEWSECSRTCDGGAAYQMRHCVGTCHGNTIRYRTCNNKPCQHGVSADFRAQQCAAYNDVEHQGTQQDWLPHYNTDRPCALFCQARDGQMIVELAPKVLDGTRCDSRSADMCINGECRRVGCDGILGSYKHLDSCGVCGGDDSSCADGAHEKVDLSLFVWEETPFSSCSVTCGVGEEKTSLVCRDSRNGQQVAERYCATKARTSTQARTCHQQECLPVWITGLWHECSRTCGGGITRRNLYCVEELDDGSFRRTESTLCVNPRPLTTKACNTQKCPLWVAGEWSPCTVTCGTGTQMRDVICRRTERHLCLSSEKPITQRKCDNKVDCLGEKASRQAGSKQALSTGRDVAGEMLLPMDQPTLYDYYDHYEAPAMDFAEGRMSEMSRTQTYAVDSNQPQASTNSSWEIEASTQLPMLNNTSVSALPKESYNVSDSARPNVSSVLDESSEWNSSPRPSQVSRLNEVSKLREMFVSNGVSKPREEDLLLSQNIDDGNTDSVDSDTIAPIPAQSLPRVNVLQGEYGTAEDLSENIKSSDEVNTSSHAQHITIMREPVQLFDTLEEDPIQIEAGDVKDFVPNIERFWSIETTAEADIPDLLNENTADSSDEFHGESTDENILSTSLLKIETPAPPVIEKQPHKIRFAPPTELVFGYPEIRFEPPPPNWSSGSQSEEYGSSEELTNIIDEGGRSSGQHEIYDPYLQWLKEFKRQGGERGIQVMESEGRDEITLAARPKDAANWVMTSWSACDKTCGRGIQTRLVVCKIYQEYTGQIQDVPDHSCIETRPPESQVCLSRPCGYDVYKWRYMGYGPCSASCLGGVEQVVHICVRAQGNTRVQDSLCTETKPDSPVRTCNDKPCPQRWRLWPYGDCSTTCGGGHRRRRVECIQELGKGEESISTLPDTECPRPVPSRRAQCAEESCPPAWAVNEWSQCSVSCGDGIQRRKMFCQQVVAPSGDVIKRWDAACEHILPPLLERECHEEECPTEAPLPSSRIEMDYSLYIQLRKEKNLMLNVGGGAVLLAKTSLYVQCTVKNFNKRNIKWLLNDAEVTGKSRVRVTKRGMLRVRKSRPEDLGNYTCVAGNSSASFQLSFHTQHEANAKFRRRTKIIENHYGFVSKVSGLGDSKEDNRPEQKSLTTLLELFNISSIPFVYVEGPWETCSQSCGGAGLQLRQVTCEVITDNYYLVVEERFCHRDGLNRNNRPLETRDCGYETCPHWEYGDWNECSTDNCLSIGVGSISRPLYCVYENGSQGALSNCGEQGKPEDIRRCQHNDCVASWRPSAWSECSISCGGRGVMDRSLQCVWRNQKPAGIHCARVRKPVVQKVCDTKPCSKMSCRDRSRFCANIPYNLCLMKKYRQRCCLTCLLKERQNNHHN